MNRPEFALKKSQNTRKPGFCCLRKVLRNPDKIVFVFFPKEKFIRNTVGPITIEIVPHRGSLTLHVAGYFLEAGKVLFIHFLK